MRYLLATFLLAGCGAAIDNTAPAATRMEALPEDMGSAAAADLASAQVPDLDAPASTPQDLALAASPDMAAHMCSLPPRFKCEDDWQCCGGLKCVSPAPFTNLMCCAPALGDPCNIAHGDNDCCPRKPGGTMCRLMPNNKRQCCLVYPIACAGAVNQHYCIQCSDSVPPTCDPCP